MKPITISFFSIVLLVGSASLLSKNEAKDLENPCNLFIYFILTSRPASLKIGNGFSILFN